MSGISAFSNLFNHTVRYPDFADERLRNCKKSRVLFQFVSSAMAMWIPLPTRSSSINISVLFFQAVSCHEFNLWKWYYLQQMPIFTFPQFPQLFRKWQSVVSALFFTFLLINIYTDSIQIVSRYFFNVKMKKWKNILITNTGFLAKPICAVKYFYETSKFFRASPYLTILQRRVNSLSFRMEKYSRFFISGNQQSVLTEHNKSFANHYG